MENLPTSGPVILATNADNLDAADVLAPRIEPRAHLDTDGQRQEDVVVRASVGGRDMLAVVRANKPIDWEEVARKAAEALQRKEVVGLPLDAAYPSGWLERLFESARRRSGAAGPSGREKNGDRQSPTYLSVGRRTSSTRDHRGRDAAGRGSLGG